MSDVTKTSIFLALALILVGLAFLTRPVVPEIKMDAMVGRNLFPKFTDPLAVKKLEIVKLNSSGEKENFRIAELDGVWTIPSHDHYPADAKEQMGKVAEGLADLNVVTVAAGQNEGVDVTTLHAMYGVIDPDSDSASLGEGVGIKVALAGANDEPLVNLIVGKPVEKGEAESLQQGNAHKKTEKHQSHHVNFRLDVRKNANRRRVQHLDTQENVEQHQAHMLNVQTA